MLRKLFISRDDHTQWRSREVTRIEGFSDAVFGFALTLLVASLEVPRTSGELIAVMRGFLPFTITFGLLFSIWYAQFRFFRRYPIEDDITITLNGILLLMVMFFVYPLKFLMDHMFDRALGWAMPLAADGSTAPTIAREHRALVWVFYGAGFTGMFTIFLLLYQRAWKLRDTLGLNREERLDCRRYIAQSKFMIILGGSAAVLQVSNAITRAYELPRSVRMPIGLTILALFAWLGYRVAKSADGDDDVGRAPEGVAGGDGVHADRERPG